jgi:FHS family L-fucose permease-like MFS transporter
MTKTSKSTLLPILVIGTLFFIFGFVTWLNSTLILYFRMACQLTFLQSLFVTFAFYISYVVMALPSSWVLQKTGFKKGMMLGLFVMSLGAFIFIPAAHTRLYGLFLTGLFLMGTGLSILQTASNPYITIVGPIESAAKRISIMGICNKVAGVLAPIIIGSILLVNTNTFEKDLQLLDLAQKTIRLNELASRIVLPYTFMAIILAVFAIMIRFSGMPEIEEEHEADVSKSKPILKTSILQFPNLILGILAIFLYVGVEVMAGDTIGPYGHSQGIEMSQARFFPALTLSAMVIGYIIGILTIPKIISQSKALAVSAITGIIFSIVAIHTHGYTSVLFIALLGLANALMWPAIWPLAIHGLGKFTKLGSAMLVMAIAGGAILPLVYGWLAGIHLIGYQLAYWIMVPCYAYILYYSLKGHRRINWRSI